MQIIFNQSSTYNKASKKCFADNLHSTWTSNQKDKSLQGVYTPFSLIEKLFNWIDTMDGKDVLVIANLEVYLLIRWGKSKNIPDFNYNSVTFLTDIKSLEGGEGVTICDLSDINITMGLKQFDVVIGNPPFNREDRKPLYHRFYNFAYNVAKDDGMVLFITPQKIIDGFSKGRLFRVKFNPINPVYVDKSIGHYFPGIGSTFCYFVVDKAEPAATTTILLADGHSHEVVDLINKDPFTPTQREFLNIHGLTGNQFYCGSTCASRDLIPGTGKFVIDKMDKGGNPVGVTECGGWNRNFKVDMSKPKLMVNILTGGLDIQKYCFKDPTGVYTPSNLNLMAILLLDNAEQVNRVYDSVKSELYAEYWELFKDNKSKQPVWDWFRLLSDDHINGVAPISKNKIKEIIF